MACFSTDLPRDDQSKTKLKTASVVNLPCIWMFLFVDTLDVSLPIHVECLTMNFDGGGKFITIIMIVT